MTVVSLMARNSYIVNSIFEIGYSVSLNPKKINVLMVDTIFINDFGDIILE